MSDRLVVLSALTLALAPSASGAQIIKVPDRGTQPILWVTFAAGAVQQGGMSDKQTNAIWNFRTPTPQWSGSIEKALRNDAAVGIHASYSRQALLYSQGTPPPGIAAASPPCSSLNSCKAHVPIYTASLAGHIGGGPSLHQLIEGGIGISQFGRFKSDAGEDLPPEQSGRDLMLNVGYGIGFSTTPRTQVTFVVDYVTTWHKPIPSGGSYGGSSSSHQAYVMRLGIRQAIGRRRVGV